MRASTLLLALPALASAQQQIPLVDQVKGWFAKASSSISSAIPSSPQAPSIPNPVASGAAKLAALKVQRINLDNWSQVLRPGAATASPGIEEWMVFTTGGNKTCHGRCERAEQAWNESVPLISASTSPPQLALLDCESEPVLCLSWSVRPPSVLHFLLPQPLADQSTPATTFRPIYLNRTTVTAPEIAAIHLQETYKEKEPYQGMFHPFDSLMAQYGVLQYTGWVLWGFNQVPSWLFMVVVSLVSRTMMNRRMGPGGQGGGQAGAQAGGAAPAPAS